MYKIFLTVITLSLLISCKSKESTKTVKPDILAMDIDSTVKPGDDFFMFANGGWYKKTNIPDAESAWGIGNMVQDEIYQKLRKINEDAVKEKSTAGSVSQKIGDFWKSGMDSAAIEAAKINPLQPDLNAIDAIKNPEDLIAVTAILHRKGVGGLFDDYVYQDDKKSDEMAFHFSQGGLGLPNRDYYFNTDASTLKVKKAYQDYMAKTFAQLDPATATVNMNNVFNLETKLAKASRKLADLRDPYKNYNKMSWDQLNKTGPSINWKSYAKEIGADKVDSVIVGQPEFITTLSNEIKQTPIDVWKNYLKLRLIQSSAAYLDSTTFNNVFEYRKAISGATKPRQRWKRGLDAEEAVMGEALGQLFVKEYFNEAAKKRYSDMVENVRAAYKERIEKLTWMNDSTKQKAYDKLTRMTKKVGYPDKWKDFSSLKIDDGPWILNMQRANEWWHQYEINKLGKPVDRTEWDMTPQTYNAYYNSSNNEIVLPAGIFSVPGYADNELDDALVYGYAAASTIGHEITHGFDDQGRQYDANGNLFDWWTKKDGEEFSNRAKKIIQQFNEFMPIDTLHVNGEATQGENIADLGGMLIGLDAFKKTDTYKKNEKISGYTPLQRYFLGYAMGWLYKSRPEKLASQVMTDVHAPAIQRVNGPVVNVPEFYEAFGIKPGDKMYRPDSLRVKIW